MFRCSKSRAREDCKVVNMDVNNSLRLFVTRTYDLVIPSAAISPPDLLDKDHSPLYSEEVGPEKTDETRDSN